MTYEQTIAYLYEHLPMFTRIGAAAYKKDLHNTIALCNALDNPQQKFISVHIAGTNGKGSTSHMLAAILAEAGYKTGLYTSPHIKDFKERIRINGAPIKEQFVIDFTERTKELCLAIQPSFFELTVAMAFDYFVQEEIDIAVIETGLGGLLDSTNVIKPILSVITNIGYDHQNILGNTLEEIALQKAGIIKQNTPVVIGETLPQTKPIFLQEAKDKAAPVFFAEELFHVNKLRQEEIFMVCEVTDKEENTAQKLQLGLTGLYQAKNICTVLAAVKQLKTAGYIISNPALQKGLAQVKQLTGISGRWDVLQKTPAIITDVAHNAAGIKNIIEQLNKEYSNAKKHFILGFVQDKDVAAVLTLFPENALYYFTNAHIPRAMPHSELAQKAAGAGLTGVGYDDVNMALTAAKTAAAAGDVIMICGSFFIIGELL